ncbi:MAG TPA: Ig-like domain-containing protein [Gaiellaceae bacterium]
MAASVEVSRADRIGPNRWASHRLQAIGVRAVVYLGPIILSIVFVHFAGLVVPAPLSSLWLYLAWWFGLSLAATVVLVAVDRFTRRLLPLAALLHLSLVFPDEAPSRFKVAFRAGNVGQLEERIAASAEAATPSEAAACLLELVAALNIHDPLTRGHCDRVRAYSVMIGEELGLSRDALDLLNWAALLHDVGKLEVPTEILAKDGRPTDQEWETLRKHPLYGEGLVRPLEAWLGTWTSAVGFHHERWDGKGYPRGLAGEEIPLPGRIVAVSDVFDVITSARSYKKASAAEEGRVEIARCAGAQFDPAVVRAFLNVSLGRMRLVMGPLAWLAHAPLLGRLPLTPALGTAVSALSVAVTSTAAGVFAPPSDTAVVASAAPVAHHARPHTGTPSHHRFPVPHRPPRRPAVHIGKRPSSPAPAAPQTPVTTPGAPPPTTAPSPAPSPSPSPPPTTTVAEPDVPPTFTHGPDVVVLEDSGATGVGWAQNFSQTVTFSTTTALKDQGLFTQLPSVSADGRLTFTPAPDAFGQAHVEVTARDGTGTSKPAALVVSILSVNDAPTFTSGGDVAFAEDGGSDAVTWATNILPGPTNEAAQHVSFNVSTPQTSLFAPGGQPTIAEDGTLSFTPAPFAAGTADVTATAIDDGGTANTGVDRSSRTFHIVITSHNHAPALAGIGDVTVNEDAPAQSLQWTTNVGPGAPSESGQVVVLSLISGNNSLFSVPPAVSQTGLLTFTPAPNADGSATVTVTARDDGGTAGGGADTTTRTFTITVASVNDAPTFSAGGAVSVLENAGAQSAPWATIISAGPPNEIAQTLHFTASNDNNSLFTSQPAIDSTGTLTFTPASGASGSATVTVALHDDGGTANGGVDTSSTATFLLAVTAVNQSPSFTAGGNVTSNEDGGVATQSWASNISAGPNESSQTVSFTVSNDNNALFTTQPAIDATGALTYTPAADANGAATVTVTAHDNGGTANGGSDTSGAATFTLTVNAVNDAPTVTPIAGQSVNEDDGPQLAAVTSFSSGPANEAAQQLTISTNTDHPEYFEPGAEPTFDASGNLSYTPATGAYGTAAVTVTVSDDGGVANGGVDTTSAAFTITLAPLPPVAGDDAYATTVGSLLNVDAAHGVLANDTSVNFPALAVTPQTTTSGLLGGTLTLAADGSFTYQSNLLQLLGGQDQFTYTVTDGNGQTANGTITIDVSLAAPSSSTFYLQTSGLSSEIWALGASAPGTVAPVPDLDGDGHEGLSITGGDGKQTIPDPNKQQAWTYETGGSTLSLHGPLTLNLTAATQNFDTGKAETLWVYVYDCPGGSSTIATTGCTLLGQNKVVVAKWNTTAAYTAHSAVVSVDRDLAPGRQLRVRVLVGGPPLWIPLVGPYQSSVDYTG